MKRATAAGPTLPTQQYRIVSPCAEYDGATLFLRASQALGHGLPKVLPAYAAGRETRPVQVPLEEVTGFEPV
jgi:hypothetical protein